MAAGRGIRDVSTGLPKGANRKSRNIHFRFGGVVMLAVALLVTGFPSVSSQESKDAVLTFEVDGKLHQEHVTISNNGQLVTIEDYADGFSVVLDYVEGVAVMRNTTSSECFLFGVENFPEYETSDTDNLIPVLVKSDDDFRQESPDTNENPVKSLVNAGTIPSEYVQVTSDPSIGNLCSDSTSYWLTEKTETSVSKRYISICICTRFYYYYGYLIVHRYYCWC